MTVGTFEKWGLWLVNLSRVSEFRIDGADVALKGSQGISEVRIPGIAAPFSARYPSGATAPHASIFIWVSAVRAVSTSEWLACDLGGAIIYNPDASQWPLEGPKLAAATAFAASLPDLLA